MGTEDQKEKLEKSRTAYKDITDELVNPGYKKLYYNNEGEIGDLDEAAEILSEAYKRMGFPLLKLVSALVLAILLLDLFIMIPLVIYSASIAFVGSLLLVYPRLAGKYKVAISATDNKKIQMIQEAELAAFSNAGFLLLLIGFVLQVIYYLFL